MNSYKDNKTRRETIMKHYSKPVNLVDSVENGIDVFSKVCVDELHLKIEDSQGKVQNVSWAGEGCAVFKSAVDIYTTLLEGKTKEEIKNLNTHYKNMINQSGEYDAEVLGPLFIYENVASHLNRLHCAEMIAMAIDEYLTKP